MSDLPKSAVQRTLTVVKSVVVYTGKATGALLRKVRGSEQQGKAAPGKRLDPTKSIAALIMTGVLCIVLSLVPQNNLIVFLGGIGYGLILPFMVTRPTV